MTLEEKYISGSCNIGKLEIVQRRRIGYIGLIITLLFLIIYLFLIFIIELEPLIGLLIFLPTFISAIGFIQARQNFCAAYGLGKRYNVGVVLGLTSSIEDRESQIKDRNKAIKIILQSFLVGIIVSFLVTVVGVILKQIVV